MVKPKAFVGALGDSGIFFYLSSIEPVSYKSALKCPIWVKAMQEEIDALHA